MCIPQQDRQVVLDLSLRRHLYVFHDKKAKVFLNWMSQIEIIENCETHQLRR